MPAITKAQFLDADDLPTTEVPLPEAYGTDAFMLLRMMTGEERSELEKRFSVGDKATREPGQFRAAILAAMCIEDNGELMFTEEDAAAVLSKNAGTLESIVTQACALAGFTKKDVDQLEKNSEASQ